MIDRQLLQRYLLGFAQFNDTPRPLHPLPRHHEAARLAKLKPFYQGHLNGYRLELRFADGLAGIVDLSGCVFSGFQPRLVDEAFFAQATVRGGTVAWPNNVYLAPDLLYELIESQRRTPAGTCDTGKRRLGFLAGAFIVPDEGTFNDAGKAEIRKMFDDGR
jgi:hypothetical protein